MRSLKNFDFYRKIPVDLTEPTTPGAIISIVCGLLMVFLLLSEFRLFLQLEENSQMFEQQEEGGKLRFNFNMTFPKMPCNIYSLDVLDIMGRHEIGVSSNIVKTRLDAAGNPVGVFPEPNVNATAMKAEGCHTIGYVEVNKVPGSFHISAHGLNHQVAEMKIKVDVNHVMHYFWAGDSELNVVDFPGSLRPLDDLDRSNNSQTTLFEYFLDVIPTVYSSPRFEDTKGYQMTAHTRHFSSPATNANAMPAVYFRYQLSPITVKFTRRRKSFTHFLTYVCAIVGGVFTVAGLLNSMLQSSIVAFQKNVLGKAN